MKRRDFVSKSAALAASALAVDKLAIANTNAATPATDLLAESFASLEQRLLAVEDKMAIETLQNQYGYYLDNRMWDQVADLFCDNNPSMEIGQRGVYVGKEKIRTFLTDVLGQGRWGLVKDEIINHIQLQMVITISDNRETARMRSRALVQGNSPPGSGKMLLAEGIYENEYVRENGQWKLKSLWWVPTYYFQVADFDKAVFDSAPPSKDYPPDQPSFPIDPSLGRRFMPFHYAHPFTEQAVPSPTGAFTQRPSKK